jgi:hypothetical protein
MKKILFYSFLFLSINFCNSQVAEQGAVLKLMNLVKDAKSVLEQGDPYAINDIVEKITTEIKYVDFNNLSDFQFKRITDLIISNVTTKREEIQHGIFLFIDSFLGRANEFVTLFLMRPDLRKVALEFSATMLKTLPELISKNPKFVQQLLDKVKNLKAGLI